MARRVRRQQSSDRTDLRSIVREELARMGMSPGKINQGQTILPSATYDAKQLGGSKARATKIMKALPQSGNLAASPANNFVPADISIMEAMYQALAPQDADTATPLYSPGVPLLPIPGITPPTGPRQFSIKVGGNISSVPRGDREFSFSDLRAIARSYDGMQICIQVWLDYVGKLSLHIEPRSELIGEDMDVSVFDADIAKYSAFFEYPDKVHCLRDWLQIAVRETLEIDALAIYLRPTESGDLYAIEILDGSTIKPLMDDRGRRPESPYPAYAQYLWGGVPAAWLTSDEILYLIESERTDDLFGTSRIEKVILRANQAQRKQSKDLLRFTEGTVPAGMIEVPSDSPWTQDQLEEFEVNLNALMAGNDQARARLKVLPKGFTYTQTDDPAIQDEFDTFLLNTTVSAFGLTMAELGFTENVNKSSGDSQENVVYRRTMRPLISRYEDLLTLVLRKCFHEERFVVKFKGFEETEDFQAQVTAYQALVAAGIQSPTQAAKALKLPVYEDLDVPPFVMTTGGPFVISDLANEELRSAQVKSQIQGLAQPPPTTPPKDTPDTPTENEPKPTTDKATRAEYRRWRDAVLHDVKRNKPVRTFKSELIPQETLQTMQAQLQRCATPEQVTTLFNAWHGSKLGVRD